jgi:hypothetical protein
MMMMMVGDDNDHVVVSRSSYTSAFFPTRWSLFLIFKEARFLPPPTIHPQTINHLLLDAASVDLLVRSVAFLHIHCHVCATDDSLEEGANSSPCKTSNAANLANAYLQTAEALEHFNIQSPVKQLNLASTEEKEKIQIEVAVPIKGIPMLDDLPEPDVKPSAAPGISADEADEPILQENANRFVLFPIKYHEVSFSFQSCPSDAYATRFHSVNHAC